MTAERAETTPRKQRGKPFPKGQSGNPSGRPVGARNRATVAMEALFDGEAEALTRRAIELGMAGDGATLRFCLERIAPARRDRPVPMTLPKLETTADAIKASSMLVEAAASGDLTPAEAADLGRLVEGFYRVAQADEIQRRVEAIEAQLKGGTP